MRLSWRIEEGRFEGGEMGRESREGEEGKCTEGSGVVEHVCVNTTTLSIPIESSCGEEREGNWN
jgi:hypothetical protein